MSRILGPLTLLCWWRRVSYIGGEVAVSLNGVIWWRRVMVEAVRGGGACFSPLPWSILGGVAPRLLTLFTLIKFAVVLCCPMVVLAMYLVSVRQLDSRSVISLAGAVSGGYVTIRFTLSLWVCDSMGVTVTVGWVWRRHSSYLLSERRHRRMEAFSRAIGGSFCLVLW